MGPLFIYETLAPARPAAYDLRHVALRNMIRRGTTQPVAMKISGQQTVSTFLRDNITSTEDIEAAMTKTPADVATRSTERSVARLDDSQNTHSRVSRRKAR